MSPDEKIIILFLLSYCDSQRTKILKEKKSNVSNKENVVMGDKTQFLLA